MFPILFRAKINVKARNTVARHVFLFFLSPGNERQFLVVVKSSRKKFCLNFLVAMKLAKNVIFERNSESCGMKRGLYSVDLNPAMKSGC